MKSSTVAVPSLAPRLRSASGPVRAHGGEHPRDWSVLVALGMGICSLVLMVLLFWL